MTDITDIVERLRDIADRLEDACVAGQHEVGSVADCTSPALRSIAIEIDALRARVAILERNGPQILSGHDGDGNPVYRSMRSVMEDYKQAAEVEAKLGDEARARVAEIEKDVMGVSQARMTGLTASIAAIDAAIGSIDAAMKG